MRQRRRRKRFRAGSRGKSWFRFCSSSWSVAALRGRMRLQWFRNYRSSPRCSYSCSNSVCRPLAGLCPSFMNIPSASSEPLRLFVRRLSCQHFDVVLRLFVRRVSCQQFGSSSVVYHVNNLTSFYGSSSVVYHVTYGTTLAHMHQFDIIVYKSWSIPRLPSRQRII